MMRSSLQIPEKVRRNAALMGAPGQAWLEELPLRITELERRWKIKIGQPMQRGSEAFVAEARTQDGLDVVIKIALPGIDPARQELRILKRANGVGYARLIDHDEANNAMLLERLGRQLHELHLPEQERIRIICATLREAWVSPPEGPPLATGAEKAVELARVIESLWRSSRGACSQSAIELAQVRGDGKRSARPVRYWRMVTHMNGISWKRPAA